MSTAAVLWNFPRQLNRSQLKKHFRAHGFRSCGTAVLPVIHVRDYEQTNRNVGVAIDEGAGGVFLINHDFAVDRFLPIIRSLRAAYPEAWLGVNFLAVTGKQAFPVLADLQNDGYVVDGYWADDARIDEQSSADDQPEAAEILAIKEECGWGGLYFGGTAFKKQRIVEPSCFQTAAAIASRWMDVVTTSGVATGKEAGVDKVKTFREGVGDNALALASGITAENVACYAKHLDAILVATGINVAGDFYNIEQTRLRTLIAKTDLTKQAKKLEK